MKQLPFVTVVLANYNYGEYIGGAIESVVQQIYPSGRMCLAIVDDGSTDDSIDKIFSCTKFKPKKDGWYEGYIREMQVLVWQNKNNYGPSYARNLAINKTLEFSDAYVVLDADDEMYPHKVPALVDILYWHPLVGSSYADYDVLNVDTGITIREYKEPFDKQRLSQECIVHSGSAIKKQALLDTREQNFYDEELRTCEDYDLWLRIANRYMIVHVPEPLTLVRVTPNNSTNAVKKSLWEANWLRVYNKAKLRHG